MENNLLEFFIVKYYKELDSQWRFHTNSYLIEELYKNSSKIFFHLVSLKEKNKFIKSMIETYNRFTYEPRAVIDILTLERI